MRQAVLLLAHGAPDRLEDVERYLSLVRAGRPLAPHLVEEIKQRYVAIGGGSPLTARTNEQAQALQQRLAGKARVHVGMRNWKPSIRDAMEQIRADGVERIVALCLAPQYSKLSVGLYFRRTQEARVELGVGADVIWTKSFHSHPLLIEAFAEKLEPLLPRQRVLFTAHSLPEKILESAEAYDAETRATARAVAARAGLAEWDFAYQSQGLTGDKWLGPTVESTLDRYAGEAVTEVVLHPIGFVSDHIEILYDVDILFHGYAAERGIRLVRPESLNDSPAFISALAAVVREKLADV
ncbi:MAG TPA: ferrochelatase [Bryobacteraceae bacterium]|nr:ferrochelatase [Bryobacteraceae bacterium]